MNPETREVWEERAAIMEYDGGLPRGEAEVLAYKDITRAHHLQQAASAPAAAGNPKPAHNDTQSAVYRASVAEARRLLGGRRGAVAC